MSCNQPRDHDNHAFVPADVDQDKDFEALAQILNRIHARDPGAVDEAFTHVFAVREDDDPRQPSFTTELPLMNTAHFTRGIEHLATARGMLLGWHGWNREPGQDGNQSLNDRVIDLLTQALGELQR